MNLVDFLLRKLRLSSEIPAPIGPQSSVGVIPFRFPDSVFAKIFYPGADKLDKEQYATEKKQIKKLYKYNVGSSGPYRYTREGVIQGMSRWTKTHAAFFRLSIGYNAVSYKFLLEPETGGAQKLLPVVIFSHGLGGNADIYSKFCSDLASHGYIVIALEHEDGSGSFAYDLKNSKKLFYIPPPAGMKYKRNNVVDFRKPFLQKRVEEIKGVIEFIRAHKKQQNTEHFKICPELEHKLFTAMNLEEMYIAGHSFGGATAVSIVHEFHNAEQKTAGDITEKEEGQKDDKKQENGERKEGATFKNVFKAVVLLDLWPFPLSPNVEAEGINLPVISIHSEGFVGNDEVLVHSALLDHQHF